VHHHTQLVTTSLGSLINPFALYFPVYKMAIIRMALRKALRDLKLTACKATKLLFYM
jgi:hypothetical protein